MAAISWMRENCLLLSSSLFPELVSAVSCERMLAGATQHAKRAGTVSPPSIAAALAVNGIIRLAHSRRLSDPVRAQPSGVDHDK
jgi:hypothetical protein